MQVSGWIIAALIACLPITAIAAQGNPAEGKAKAEAAGCNACHGPDGVANQDGLAIDKNMPNLAGEPDLYLQFQLVYFRKGVRKNDYMNPVAESLSDVDIRNLGAYFASLEPPKASKPDDNPDLSQKGAQAAVGRRCASCHTDTFAGTKAVARIAGQREEYLLKALHDYKSGVRSGGAGAAMSDVAYPLSEEEMTALAHYLAHL
jgi:cytochrome c553